MSRFHDLHRLRGREWAELRQQTLDAAGWRCRECGAYGNEVDHIIPLRKGGAPRAPENLACLCARCHSIKTRTENRRQLSPAEVAWRNFAGELLDGQKKSATGGR